MDVDKGKENRMKIQLSFLKKDGKLNSATTMQIFCSTYKDGSEEESDRDMDSDEDSGATTTDFTWDPLPRWSEIKKFIDARFKEINVNQTKLIIDRYQLVPFKGAHLKQVLVIEVCCVLRSACH